MELHPKKIKIDHESIKLCKMHPSNLYLTKWDIQVQSQSQAHCQTIDVSNMRSWSHTTNLQNYQLFSYHELVRTTSNFTDDNLLGQNKFQLHGGFFSILDSFLCIYIVKHKKHLNKNCTGRTINPKYVLLLTMENMLSSIYSCQDKLIHCEEQNAGSMCMCRLGGGDVRLDEA